MAERLVAADASPLIGLAAAGEFDLLRRLFGQLTITNTVRDEVLAGADLPGAAELAAAIRDGWIQVEHTPAAKAAFADLDLLLPAPVLPPVDHHQVTGLGRAAVHVARRLLHALVHHAFQPVVLAHHLALHHELLHPVGQRPHDQQVHPATPQRVLRLDAAAAVHHPLQVRLQQQLRLRFLVREAVPPVLAVAADVLPVCRGACSTKYCSSRTSPRTSSRSMRSSGGMQ
ncbi:MAG: hypothetical protein OXH96_18565 [Spirochaetaceae bacterium]|nr:hypothetical protein [Spirochaetaceae bacterium]